jgi:RimJ/RimL family protein N-acetyltransferase
MMMRRRNYYFLTLLRFSLTGLTIDTPHVDTDGTVIGCVGLYNFSDSEHPPKLGYMFFPWAWGKGYATEAVKGVLDSWWSMKLDDTLVFSLSVDERQDVGKLWASTKTSNLASTAVLRKTGWSVHPEHVDEDVDENGNPTGLWWVMRRPIT